MGSESLAARVSAAYEELKRRRSDLSHTVIAAELTELGRTVTGDNGYSMSAAYFGRLRSGAQTKPSIDHIEVLAEYFGKPRGFFLGDPDPAGEEATARALVDAGLAEVALRGIPDMSASGLAAVLSVMRLDRQAQGLPPIDEETP